MIIIILTIIIEKSEFESDVCEKNDDIQQPAMTPDEALPDMDNYRNMQSLNGGIKSRPTLLELQVIFVFLIFFSHILLFKHIFIIANKES